MVDFEDVTLDSDEENNAHYYDGFEEVELADNVDMHYGTKKCRCVCHDNPNARFQMRKRHCLSCGMQVSCRLAVLKSCFFWGGGEHHCLPCGVQVFCAEVTGGDEHHCLSPRVQLKSVSCDESLIRRVFISLAGWTLTWKFISISSQRIRVISVTFGYTADKLEPRKNILNQVWEN